VVAPIDPDPSRKLGRHQSAMTTILWTMPFILNTFFEADVSVWKFGSVYTFDDLQ
jgi:hypothetical protein